MSQSSSLTTLAVSAAAAFALAAFVVLSPEFAFADSLKPQTPQHPRDSAKDSCTCPGEGTSPWARPKFAGIGTRLDESDQIAALESIQFALTEIGDGATYVWHRHGGEFSGFVQPTSSFKDGSGNICRHVVVMLSSNEHSRRAEGIACRMQGGRWRLEG